MIDCHTLRADASFLSHQFVAQHWESAILSYYEEVREEQMLVIRLSANRRVSVPDPLGRAEIKYRPGLSEAECWIRARGYWKLDERRVLSESYAIVVSPDWTILCVAEITGLSKCGDARAIEGNLLLGHDLVGRKCPFTSTSKNSISYFDDIPALGTIGHTASWEDEYHSKPLSLPLRTISLFSGAGGLDAGFNDRSKYKLLACVEYDHACCESLRANRDAGRLGESDTKVIEADISKLDPAELLDTLGIKPGDVDVIIGGPPCQSWSTTGKRGTAQDARGMLIWHFLRFVETIQPDYFLMENVRGILSGEFRHRPIAERPEKGGPALSPEELPGSAIKIWLDDATNLLGGRYRVDYYEVNSVNYGAPEIRERVLFFGNKREQVIRFPQPTHGPNSESKTPYRTLRDAIGSLYESDEERMVLDFSPRKKKYLSYVPEGGNWRAMPEDIQRESMGKAWTAKGGRSGWWRRLSWDLPSPTIVTMPNHASTSLCHPSETRALSVAECARIQEFPDGWAFRGSVAERMRQVGNAVPVRLAKIAADVIVSAATSPMKDHSDSSIRVSHEYIFSMVRTRKWFKQGTVFVHSNGTDKAMETT